MALFGFTSIKDMFDGGGRGGSGANFSTKSHSEYKKANPKDTTVKAHTSKSSSKSPSKNSSGSSKSSTPTFKSLSEAAKAGYHGQTVNIAGKGKQKVSFDDKSYDKKMAAASNAASSSKSSGGLKSLGTAIKNAPKNIVQDIGMGLNMVDRDADYYRRTADTIARTQGEDAAKRYISQMTAKGGDAAAGVKKADVAGSVSYGQRIGMLNQDGSVNKNYMGNNDGGGSNVITPAAEDIQSPQDQFRNNQAMLNRMRMMQGQQYTQGRNMDMARRMFESQNMMSPGFMPRQMQGIGGFMQQPFRPQVNPYTQAGQRPSMYPGQTVQPMQTPQQMGGKGAQLNRLLGGYTPPPNMPDYMQTQPATPIQPQGPKYYPMTSMEDMISRSAASAEKLEQDAAYKAIAEHQRARGIEAQPVSRDKVVSTARSLGLMTQGPQVNPYTQAGQRPSMYPGQNAQGQTTKGMTPEQRLSAELARREKEQRQRIPPGMQVALSQGPQGPQVNPYIQGGQRPSMYPGQNAQPSMFNPYQQQPFNPYQQPMSGKGGGQTMRQSRFGSPAFNYASQNYDRLGGMQRTMPRPMEMMSNAERQQIGQIADSFQPQPMSGKGGGQTMRQPMSGKGGGVTKPQYGGFLGGYF